MRRDKIRLDTGFILERNSGNAGRPACRSLRMLRRAARLEINEPQRPIQKNRGCVMNRKRRMYHMFTPDGQT